MKNNLSKIIALFLVFTFVFALSACKKQAAETTTAAVTTSAETTTTPGTTATIVTTLPAQTTTAAQTTATPVQTTAKPAVTTTKQASGTIKAPVGGTKAQIVAFYNKYANATKAYNGNVTVSGKQGISIKLISATGDTALKNTINNMLSLMPNPYSTITPVTFKNGKDISGGTATLIKTLPRSGQAKMSTLEAAGVKSASCVKSGTGWKILITLKTETETDFSAVPKYHSECMDTTMGTKSGLQTMFTISSSKVIYTDKSTITAVVNAKGLLSSVSIVEPDDLSGVLAAIYVPTKTLKIHLTGVWQQDLNFKY